MSMPPNRAYDSSYHYVETRGGTVVTDTNYYSRVVKVQSSSSKSPKVPLPVRIKTWYYRGRKYERLAGWVYPPKRIKVAPETWRPPKAYRASLKEGDVTTCYGSYGQILPGNPSLGTVTVTQQSIGDIPVASAATLPAFPGYSPGLESRAVIKALSRLKDQKVNLAVAFFERAETAELLVSTLAGLTKAANSLRHGNMRGVARGLGLSGSPKSPKGQNFHQKWLELQYGWQPLYSDVFGAVEALHGADQASPKRYCTSVRGQVSASSSLTRNQTISTAQRWFSQTEIKETALVRLDYYLDNPLLASLSALGITNPLEVAWERVPFSFVADWFIPVGNYLSSMDAALGYRFRGGSLSRVYKQKLTGYLAGGNPSGGWFPYNSYGTVNSRSLDFDRSVYTSSPLPRVPSFKNPFPRGSTHIANAIALFASSLRG